MSGDGRGGDADRVGEPGGVPHRGSITLANPFLFFEAAY